jgi:hypothetical protein
LLLGGKMNDCPTTLYPKERGLSVSFNSSENPASAGFLLSALIPAFTFKIVYILPHRSTSVIEKYSGSSLTDN